MQKTLVLFTLIVAAMAPASAQRRGAPANQGARATRGNVTLAIAVADPAGAPIGDVKVTLSGAADRTGRSEAGRLAFEGLPAGTYRLRFDRDGFVPFEKELAARGAAPVEVKVTLTPAPAPPPAPVPAVPAAPSVIDAKLVVLDMPAYVEKYYVGKAPSKTNTLACATAGSSTLIQLNEALPEHTHADADEFIYVIAGQGMATMGTRKEPLGPGVFMLIPRGTAHAIGVGPKKPLEFISTRAGERCPD